MIYREQLDLLSEIKSMLSWNCAEAQAKGNTVYQERTTSYAHQSKARMKAKRRKAFAFLMEMGTGKTKVDIDESMELFLDGEIDTWLIVAPKGVYMNWPETELPVHVPTEFWDTIELAVWRGGANAARRLEEVQRPSEKLRILVINVEAFSASPRAYEYVKKFMEASKLGAKFTIDESPVIKNPGSRRTKACMDLRKLAKYRRILTGNSCPNGPLDNYSQFTWLDERILGFTSFFSFRARYAVLQKQRFGGRTVQIVVGYRDTEGLATKIAPHSFRVLKSECLTLPPKVYQQRNVEMTEQQARMYRELRKSATTIIEEGGAHVTATEVIVQMTRLHQLLCGFIVDETGCLHDIPHNRITETMEVTEEASGKMIIWALYRHSIGKIVEALSEAYGSESVLQYHGGVSNADRSTAIKEFQEGKPRFFVGNPATAGRGITLTAAETVLYYANGFSLDERIQSEDRPHRAGLTHSVNYIDLVVPNTLDVKVLKALRDKIDISSVIMGDGYRSWLI